VLQHLAISQNRLQHRSGQLSALSPNSVVHHITEFVRIPLAAMIAWFFRAIVTIILRIAVVLRASRHEPGASRRKAAGPFCPMTLKLKILPRDARFTVPSPRAPCRCRGGVGRRSSATQRVDPGLRLARAGGQNGEPHRRNGAGRDREEQRVRGQW
jgi:hypothetical protein